MTSHTQTADVFRARLAHAVIYSGFVLTGVVTTLLGPMLPILSARWAMTDQRAGWLFTVQFCASLAGIAALGPLISRRGYGATLVAGFTGIALGIAGLARANESIGMFATAAFGFGLGLILSGANLWVAEVSSARRASALSVLNLAWGIGATASAPLVLVALRYGDLKLLLYAVAASSALIALAVVAMDIEPPPQKSASAETDSARALAAKASMFALGALFFLYVGTENSVGGWAAALAKRAGAAAGNPWELAPAFFWAGLLAGRALTPIALLRVTERALLRTGLAVGGASCAGLLRAESFRSTAACAALAGLGLASVYPLLVSGMVGRYGEHARSSGRVMFALACMGGATMPWFVGFTSTHAHSLRAGFLIPFVACLAMIGLLWFLPEESSG